MDLSAGDSFLHPKIDFISTKKNLFEYQVKWNQVLKQLDIEEMKINDLEAKGQVLFRKIGKLQQDLAEEKSQYRQDIDRLIEKRSQIPFEMEAISSEASFNLIHDAKGKLIANNLKMKLT